MTVDNLATLFDPATCKKRGLCPVTQIRHQATPLESHSLYYEIHGISDDADVHTRVVFIMGLNSSSFAWSLQAEHFARLPGYQILLLDNRGVGHSGTPKGPYTTQGMAEDVVVLLDYLGQPWTQARALNIVGVSLGGMIAQGKYELRRYAIYLTPTNRAGFESPRENRVADAGCDHGRTSVNAATAILESIPSTDAWQAQSLWPSAYSEMRWLFLTRPRRLMFTADIEQKIPLIIEMVYPRSWLDERAEDDEQSRTNRELQVLLYRKRISTTAPQRFIGGISQMAAALTHRVSPDRLRRIHELIPYIHIATGDQDNLVAPTNSHHIKSCMPNAGFEQWEATGHALHVQRPKRFNAMLEKTFAEGRRKLDGN
ncbi:FACT complex subunit SPT16 [Mycena kentingensis (nom. inval.)]|nr:FACT complex subunit SPT16 [Mycena kentingensis (nom. inval.)]